MGFFSSDSQTTQQTTNFVDNSSRTANQAGAQLAVTGDNNRVTSYRTETDHGAVKDSISAVSKALADSLEFGRDALGFGDGALKFSSETSARAYEFGTKSVDDAFALSKGIAEQSTATANEVLGKAINAANSQSAAAYQFATSVARPNDQNTANLKIISIAAVAIASAFMFAKYAGK